MCTKFVNLLQFFQQGDFIIYATFLTESRQSKHFKILEENVIAQVAAETQDLNFAQQ